MELTMINGFCEMNQMEMQEVDGGMPAWLIAAGGAVVKGCAAVGTFCGATAAAPVVGAVVIVGTVTAVGVGIYVGCNN